jgi:NADPH:quinone reductase-like Zn-dependent oxidoreductase
VIVGSEVRGRWMGGFDRNLRAVALSRLLGQRLRMLSSKPRQEDLEVLRELIEAGKVTPVIGRSYPLAEVPEAIRQMVEGRGGGGKVVITV